MKKFLAGVIIGFLLASSAAISAVENIKLIVNDVEINCDVPPQIINGRTMVPARFVAEPLGANVEWDGNKNTVIITSQIEPDSEAENNSSGSGNWWETPVNEYFYLGRYIVETLAAKYPSTHVTLSELGSLIFGENVFELPQMIDDRGMLRTSVKPLIEAGMLTLEDLSTN